MHAPRRLRAPHLLPAVTPALFPSPSKKTNTEICLNPYQCPSAKDVCGVYTQCGFAIECGAGCGDGQVCARDRSKCIPEEKRAACVPATACPTGIECGTFDDGCGGVMTCGPPEYAGNCAPGETCSAARACEAPASPCTPKQVRARGACGSSARREGALLLLLHARVFGRVAEKVSGSRGLEWLEGLDAFSVRRRLQLVVPHQLDR